MPINSFLYPAPTNSNPYEVANSLRFNSGSSDFLNRTPSSAGNRKTYTLSWWMKIASLGTDRNIIQIRVDTNNRFNITLTDADKIAFQDVSGGTRYGHTTDSLFRDPSAWYHFVVKVDTTQSSSSDRLRIYANNVESNLSAIVAGYPPQNHDTLLNSTNETFIGKVASGSSDLNGYIAEMVLIDGQALDPTSFGKFDSDTNIWIPKEIQIADFGTNGFYLDFENSSSLGADVSGNGNNFTVNNLTSIDQTTDTCTNNFCTLNPLDNDSSTTFSEGNCKAVTDSSLRKPFYGTFHLTQGKWYWEVKMIDIDTNNFITGISGSFCSINDVLGYELYDYGYRKASGLRNNDSDTAYGNTYADGDIVGVYLDLDNNKLYFAKNGTIQNSGTGISISDPSVTAKGGYAPAGSDFSVGGGSTVEFNFGNPTFSISSGNSDPNGYGNFEYSPNDGGSASFDSTAKDFYALNSKNLAEYG